MIGEQAVFNKQSVDKKPLCPFVPPVSLSPLHPAGIRVQRNTPFLMIPSLTLSCIAELLVLFDSESDATERGNHKVKLNRCVRSLFKNANLGSDHIQLLCSPLHLTRGLLEPSQFKVDAAHWGVAIFSLTTFKMQFGEGLEYPLESAHFYGVIFRMLAIHFLECVSKQTVSLDVTSVSSEVELHSFFEHWQHSVVVERLPYPIQRDGTSCGELKPHTPIKSSVTYRYTPIKTSVTWYSPPPPNNFRRCGPLLVPFIFWFHCDGD